MRLFRLLPWILVSSLAAADPADLVVLVNGDRLTGSIERLEEGTLVLRSKLLGMVRVDWTDVRSIASEKTLSVMTERGREFTGQLNRQDGETLIVQHGGSVTKLPSGSVVRIAPETRTKGPARILRALTGTADLGHSLARGNQNQMQSSLGARAEYRSARYEFSGRLDSLFARQDGARSQSRHALNLRLDRFVNARVFTYGLSGLERNERRKLDLRTRLGGGVGWRLRDRGDTELSVLGGFAYVHERFRAQENRVAGEGFFGVEWETLLLQVVELSTQVTMHPDLVGSGRIRLEYDSTFRVPIAGRFTYSLRVFDRYDNRPATTVARNDYGIVSGLGVGF